VTATETQQFTLTHRLAAEAIGTALLLATVVGSRIMGERLAGGNVAVALLANTLATGAALVALVLTFGPICGAHFNPAVTLADASQGGIPWRDVPAYVVAQIAGAFVGVAAAHIMFEFPLFFASRYIRSGPAQASAPRVRPPFSLACSFDTGGRKDGDHAARWSRQLGSRRPVRLRHSQDRADSGAAEPTSP
jgi:glycerol uptake facilitator-like aquaporin